MRQIVTTIQIVFICLATIAFCTQDSIGRSKLEIQPLAKKVGKYEKLEILINADTSYDNPFDPDQVDLTVTLKTPDNRQIVLPAAHLAQKTRNNRPLDLTTVVPYWVDGEGRS